MAKIGHIGNFNGLLAEAHGAVIDLLYAELEPAMATMTIRNIDDQLKSRLRMRAALHGRSMEEEARDILRSALSSTKAKSSLLQSIRARLPKGGVDLELPPRDAAREPPSFE